MKELTRASRDPADLSADLPERIRIAIEKLGTAILRDDASNLVRERLEREVIRAEDYYRWLTRFVYRLLFLIVAEDQGLLSRPTDDGASRERTDRHDTMRALRRLARSADVGSTRNKFEIDLWRIIDGTPGQAQDLIESGVSALWSSLWRREARSEFPIGGRDLPVAISDETILEILRILGPLDGADRLDGDALASAYEWLLELRPIVHLERRSFALIAEPGHERKATGSYYTPDKLVQHLLDHALEPIIAGRIADLAPRDAERALLSIRVCDPACGAGAFLIGAARRLATHLIRLRGQSCGGSTNSQARALSEIIDHCVYGVDANPMAIELCRFRLWLETAAAGEPPAILKDRLKVGHALLGATRSTVATQRLEVAGGLDERLIWDVALAETAFGCDSPARKIASRGGSPLSDDALAEIRQLADDHQFFHWEREFPEVFDRPDDCNSQGRLEAGHASGFDVVVGNPPFLNQLESATVAPAIVAAILRAKTEDKIRGYVDLSAAFLIESVRLLRTGGRVALVQPQSLIAARDAGAVRRSLAESTSMVHLWIANEAVFSASIMTCAPVLQKNGPRRLRLTRATTLRFKKLPPIELDMNELTSSETWGHFTAELWGLPNFDFESNGVIGDLADATADFRDQYYGLEGFLIEDADVPADKREHFPPVITTGLIDLVELHWGDRSTRLHKRRWQAPRVDRDRMEREGKLGPWMKQRLVPKILLATQTRVIELVVDEEGGLLPSTPTITLTPREPDTIWRIAAALASPVATALSLLKYAGAGLSADAIKLSARQALRLPLPANKEAWEEATHALRQAASAPTMEAHRRELRTFAKRSVLAYEIRDQKAGELIEWWWRRLIRVKRRRESHGARELVASGMERCS